MARLDDPCGDPDFAFVIEAQPEARTADSEAAIDKLAQRLFILLSFVASQHVGVWPVCGLSDDGDVVWAKWAAPRVHLGTTGVRWCSRNLVAKVLPEIAMGFTRLSTSENKEIVVARAIEHLLAADAIRALDVQIPVACTGLELLAWAQRLEVTDATKTMRRLLVAAQVPTVIPEAFDALIARCDDKHQDGPAVLNEVRNRLVHPPRALSLEFPSPQARRQAWQLAAWYLELTVLHALGYQGRYGSRLRLSRHDADISPVPWSSAARGG
jgi:hypothetical protein